MIVHNQNSPRPVIQNPLSLDNFPINVSRLDSIQNVNKLIAERGGPMREICCKHGVYRYVAMKIQVINAEKNKLNWATYQQ